MALDSTQSGFSMEDRFKKVKEHTATTAVPEETTTEAPAQTKPNDILADLAPEVKPKAKSYGFYLDDDVVKALDRLAKAKKSNRSKMLNTLLRKLLIEE